ncbi:MAG: hypothetical protein J6V99_08475 [Neisseriaceae bacterium]|nr:hypothetical protein [Neisseriaceae bacterium]
MTKSIKGLRRKSQRCCERSENASQSNNRLAKVSGCLKKVQRLLAN